jgi:hypothetical protein
MGRRDPILAHPPASRLSGSGNGEPAGGENRLNIYDPGEGAMV